MKEQDEKSSDRAKETKSVGMIGVIGNLFLFVIKMVAAYLTKSQSMLADSINSGTDILASLMTVIGGKIAGEPSDEEHNYGHGKAEYIFSMLISVLTICLSVKVMLEGVKNLILQEKFSFSIWLVVVCVITILLKIILYIYAKKKGEKSNNILILANAQDHLNDVLVTFSVIVGVLGAIWGIYWLDGIIAIFIAIRICYMGGQFFMDSYQVLMDSSMKDGEKQIIREMIEKHGEIDHIDSVTSKAVGNRFVVIVKISVNENMTVKESHAIAGKIKAEIMTLDNVYDVVVHINPA